MAEKQHDVGGQNSVFALLDRSEAEMIAMKSNSSRSQNIGILRSERSHCNLSLSQETTKPNQNATQTNVEDVYAMEISIRFPDGASLEHLLSRMALPLKLNTLKPESLNHPRPYLSFLWVCSCFLCTNFKIHPSLTDPTPI
jgi:hypothetical protein